MPLHFIYIIYTSAIWLAMMLLVSKHRIQELAAYGIIFGGLADGLLIIVLGLWLKLGAYINYGPFGFNGLPFFPPLAWAAFFVLYFNFLPGRRLLRYLYMLTAVINSVLFSNVLSSLGIFRWNYGRLLLPFIIYSSWIGLATWGFKALRKGGDGA